MHYPLIIVERPHLRPGRAWVARTVTDVADCLSGGGYGDNWSYERYTSLADVEASWGGSSSDDIPPELYAAIQGGADWPIVYTTYDGGAEAMTESEADTLEDFALEYIGHDLHALDVLESAEEAAALLASRAHHIPRAELREAMEDLGWHNCDLEGELIRVTGDHAVSVHYDDDGSATVGWLDESTGAGDTCGHYRDPIATAAILRGLPEWDGSTDDWSALRIPEFDD